MEATRSGETRADGDAAGDAGVVKLDYAPGPRISRRVRRLIWAVGVIAVMVAGWYWGRPYWRQAKVVWEQRKLTHFKAPAGTVAFTNDPEEAKRLLGRGKHVRVELASNGLDGYHHTRWAGYAPTDADELFGRSAAFMRNLDLGDGDPAGPAPTLYLGLRRAGRAEPRLVHSTLTLWTEWGNGFPVLVRSDLYAPATYRPGSARVQLPNAFRGLDECFEVPLRLRRETGNSGMATLRIFYGESDPADESRIVIPYEYDGEKGRLLGQLKATRFGEMIEWCAEGPIITGRDANEAIKKSKPRNPLE